MKPEVRRISETVVADHIYRNLLLTSVSLIGNFIVRKDIKKESRIIFFNLLKLVWVGVTSTASIVNIIPFQN